jgi:hypothetical protein
MRHYQVQLKIHFKKRQGKKKRIKFTIYSHQNNRIALILAVIMEGTTVVDFVRYSC